MKTQTYDFDCNILQGMCKHIKELCKKKNEKLYI